MSSQITDNPFCLSRENYSCPRTPTLPSIQDTSASRSNSFRNRNLKIITNVQQNFGSPASKPRKMNFDHTPVRKKLIAEFDNQFESLSSVLPQSDIIKKKSCRSLSTCVNDKAKHYLNEINNLNTKIRNLIKEQDSLRDKLVTQENIIMSMHKDYVKPVIVCHDLPSSNIYNDIQSATIPRDSIDESFFQVTFKPDEKWVQPRSRRFPREVFCKASRNRMSCL